MAEMRRTPWRCMKCRTNKVETSTDPMDRLQPTLAAGTMIGFCHKCKQRRMFDQESSG